MTERHGCDGMPEKTNGWVVRLASYSPRCNTTDTSKFGLFLFSFWGRNQLRGSTSDTPALRTPTRPHGQGTRPAPSGKKTTGTGGRKETLCDAPLPPTALSDRMPGVTRENRHAGPDYQGTSAGIRHPRLPTPKLLGSMGVLNVRQRSERRWNAHHRKVAQRYPHNGITRREEMKMDTWG